MKHLPGKRINKAYLKEQNIKPKYIPYFFLLPNAGFYFLSAAIALVLFFLIWGVLLDTGEKSPWIFAGIFSSLILLAAVLLREFVWRDARRKYLLAAVQYRNKVRRDSSSVGKSSTSRSFTLERNSSFLKLIEKNSKAARFNKNLPAMHLEVFELCNEYLRLTDKELEKIELGSTKWGAIKNGRKRVRDFHKHHLISWAAIESRRLTKAAKLSGSVSKKIETAQRANLVLESALSFYPENPQLLESIEAVSDFTASVKIAHWIELAERDEFKGNYNRAINHYKDALFYLTRENMVKINKEEIAQKINSEIEKLRKLKSEN